MLHLRYYKYGGNNGGIGSQTNESNPNLMGELEQHLFIYWMHVRTTLKSARHKPSLFTVHRLLSHFQTVPFRMAKPPPFFFTVMHH